VEGLEIENSAEYQDHTAIEEKQPTGNYLMVKDDPRYATYFTMLRLRVPPSAIKQKMMYVLYFLTI